MYYIYLAQLKCFLQLLNFQRYDTAIFPYVVLEVGVIRLCGTAEFEENCLGIRNSSNFSAERRNSPPLPYADILENDKRNAEFS